MAKRRLGFQRDCNFCLVCSFLAPLFLGVITAEGKLHIGCCPMERPLGKRPRNWGLWPIATEDLRAAIQPRDACGPPLAPCQWPAEWSESREPPCTGVQAPDAHEPCFTVRSPWDGHGWCQLTLLSDQPNQTRTCLLPKARAGRGGLGLSSWDDHFLLHRILQTLEANYLINHVLMLTICQNENMLDILN